MKVLNILLDAEANPLKPLMSLIGLGIALIWLFTRNAKKEKKDDSKRDDDKNKMQ